MIDLAFVESLIRALDESGLDSLEVERGGTRVRLSKSPPAAQQAAPIHQYSSVVADQGGPNAAPMVTPLAVEVVGGEDEEDAGVEDGLLEVTSPMVGTFYSAPAPDSAPYAEIGQRVGKGTVLCIIEAMKLMNELESEVEGTIVKIMVENAQPVEYGQVLFLIDPS